MAKAAEAHDKHPRLVSFKGALQTMTAFQDALRLATPNGREHLCERCSGRSPNTTSVTDSAVPNHVPTSAGPNRKPISRTPPGSTQTPLECGLMKIRVPFVPDTFAATS